MRCWITRTRTIGTFHQTSAYLFLIIFLCFFLGNDAAKKKNVTTLTSRCFVHFSRYGFYFYVSSRKATYNIRSLIGFVASHCQVLLQIMRGLF